MPPKIEASVARLYAFAAEQGCQLFNLSNGISRLTFSRISFMAFSSSRNGLPNNPIGPEKIALALAREAELAYYVPSGHYWKDISQFDKDALIRLNALWMQTTRKPHDSE